MPSAFTIFLFALDRVRTVLLALSLIVLMKAAWLLVAPAAGQFLGESVSSAARTPDMSYPAFAAMAMTSTGE